MAQDNSTPASVISDSTPPVAPAPQTPVVTTMSLTGSSALQAPSPAGQKQFAVKDSDAMALSKMGFSHLVQNTDIVGLMVLTIMITMSILSWFFIVFNTLKLWAAKRLGPTVVDGFWNSGSPAAANDLLSAQPDFEPFSKLALDAADAAQHHADSQGGRMAEALTRHEFIERALRASLARQRGKFDSGLTLLATVGSTAPFVGLFGTVWGIYHALIGIGIAKKATLDVVAGPVGEALIMTCIGLGVAIPAVLAYNFFVRHNQSMVQRFFTFANDLMDFFATGSRVRAQRYGNKNKPVNA
jgi:biopolymer transport protein ExbB